MNIKDKKWESGNNVSAVIDIRGSISSIDFTILDIKQFRKTITDNIGFIHLGDDISLNLKKVILFLYKNEKTK